MGLYPGLVSTYSIAALGQFEIELVPVFPDIPLGGGAGLLLSPKPVKYLLKIRVSRKGKTWNHESKISVSTAKVIAKFLGRELPTVAVVDTRVIEQETPEVEVRHVSTTKTR